MAVIITRLKEHIREILLALLVLAILGPVFYFGRPLHLTTPDLKYAKAKVLQISQGDIFADPVTGFDTFHPPYFYLVLAGLRQTGLAIDTALVVMIILQVTLLVLLSYITLRTAFDRSTAFLTCLMIPFIVPFMGSLNILLANSFYFSVPFYLGGLWLYLKPQINAKRSVLIGLLWGFALLISPVYIFLLGLTFLYELLNRKRYKHFLIMAATFLITIIPFFIQAGIIFSWHLWGSSAFAFWRGVPGGEWAADLMTEFITPAHVAFGIPSAIHLIILLTAVMLMIRTRRVYWYVPLSLAAYLLTFYHFSGQYAIRIHLFFSLFLVASLIGALRTSRIKPLVWQAPLGLIVAYSLVFYYTATVPNFQYEAPLYSGYQEVGRQLWDNADKYLAKNRYVFCTKRTYLDYLGPWIPVHSLGAYKTMEYFQLNSRIAADLNADYETAMASSDYDTIAQIAGKYGITAAVISGADVDIPLFKVLLQRWKTVYRDDYFIIVKKPA